MFADYSPDFLRFAARYGKVFSADRAGFEALIAPNLLFVGEVVLKLPLRLPPSVSPPKAEFAYIEVKDFPQGVVAKEGEVGCAGLYHSYPICLLECFGIIMSNPQVLALLGDTSLEEAKPFYAGTNPPGFQHWTDEVKLRYWGDLIPRFLPRDAIRQETAFYMMHVALRFLWFHEMAHILDGHLEYAVSELKLSHVCFHSSDGAEKLYKDAELRALEIIADSVACQLSLRGLLQHEDKFMPAAIKALPVADQLLVHLAAIMSLCWFWFARDAQVAVELGGVGTLHQWSDHPSNIARLTRIVGTYERLLERRTNLAHLSLKSAFIKLGNESEAMASMDWSMEFLRTVKTRDVADAVFAVPFMPPKSLFTLMTTALKSKSYIYRYLDGPIF